MSERRRKKLARRGKRRAKAVDARSLARLGGQADRSRALAGPVYHDYGTGVTRCAPVAVERPPPVSPATFAGKDLQTLSPRERILAMEALIQAQPGHLTAMPTTHYFGGGVYARELFIPAGMVLTGYIHKREHLAMVGAGDLSICDEDGLRRVQGPQVFVSARGVKRALYAHSDALFITFHRPADPAERDIETLERELLAGSYEQFEEFMKTEGLDL